MLEDELLDHIISPYADISVGLIKYGGIILLLLVVIGALYELLKRFRGMHIYLWYNEAQNHSCPYQIFSVFGIVL